MLGIRNAGKVGLVFVNIGQNGGGTGKVRVNSPGSQFLTTAQSTSGITVGTDGSGALAISNCGQVEAMSNLPLMAT